MGSGEGTLLTIGHALGNNCTHFPLPCGFNHPASSSSVPGISPILLQLQWVPCRQPQQGRAEQEVPHNLQQRAERDLPGEPTPTENLEWKVSHGSHHCKNEA